MAGEFALIDWIRQRAASSPHVPIGIGDDAASLRFERPTDCLVAVDTLIEGVHFLCPEMTAAQIGRKSLAVNLSDIAAMAGKPLAAVVGLVVNRQFKSEFAQEIMAGILDLAQEFDVAIIGGDTNTSDGPCIISVTVLGEAMGSGPVTRSGAQIGDWIFVTGEFGGSLAEKHYAFTPRIHEATQLHEMVTLHSMIDVSDGLSADLFHVLEESHVGASIDATAIPISQAAATPSQSDDRNPLEHALGDGEDFELLFTVSPEEGSRLLESPPFATRLTKIGEIQPEGIYQLHTATGEKLPLKKTGWEHDLGE